MSASAAEDPIASIPDGAEHLEVALVCPEHVKDLRTAADAFLRYVWAEGGGLGAPTVLDEGKVDESGKAIIGSSLRIGPGHRRRVGGGVIEEILKIQDTTAEETGGPRDTGRGQEVRIYYRVAGGPFPVSFHLGRLVARYVDAEESGTGKVVELRWTVDWVPMRLMGYVVKGVISIAIRYMCETLKKKLEQGAGS